MRVAVYNQMFGLDGRTAFSFFKDHWFLHFQDSKERLRKQTDLTRTVDILKKAGADIVGLCEVLESSERELTNKLSEIGYPYVYFANGHTLRCGLQVKTAIASKTKGIQIEVPEIPREHRIGGGGGIIACKFNPDFYFVNAHLSIPGKGPYEEQINLLQDVLRKLGRRVVLTGDFNKTYEELKISFPDLNLTSGRIKTCICQGALRYYLNKDFDHIFTKGFETIGNGSLTGYSDHKLVYADLE